MASSHFTMKLNGRLRVALILVLAFAILWSANLLKAAPPALNCTSSTSSITSPKSGATLNGVVQIEGTASLGGQFQYYKLEFAPSGNDNFTVFSGLIRQQVSNGQLAVWDSASVPDGSYSIRLRVVDVTGNYCDNPEALVTGLIVQNSVPLTPTEAPTDVPTEAPALPAVVPTAVPTIQIGVPTEPGSAATPTAAATAVGVLTPGSSSILPGVDTNSILDGLRQVFGNLMRTFLFGVVTMAGIMLVIGVIFFVRRVL